jgi:hypothetical protein
MKLFISITAILVALTVITCAQDKAPEIKSITNVNTPEMKKAIDDAVAKALSEQQATLTSFDEIKNNHIKIFERARGVESPFTAACKAVGAKEILVSISNGQANLVCPVPLKK